MHEMQTGLSRMAANTSKPWRYSKNQQNSLYFVSRRKSHSIHEFFCTNATLTSLTIPSSASVTTVSKQTPANAKILTATQGTLNQMSSKFRLQTQNKSLAICSKTRTIRTGVTTTTSSEIAHETAKCLVRTLPTLTTPGSFRNSLRIASAIRYSGQETNVFSCLTWCLCVYFTCNTTSYPACKKE